MKVCLAILPLIFSNKLAFTLVHMTLLGLIWCLFELYRIVCIIRSEIVNRTEWLR